MEFEMNLEQTLNEITGKLYGKNIGACTDAQPVSYTHLTLPTICSV